LTTVEPLIATVVVDPRFAIAAPLRGSECARVARTWRDLGRFGCGYREVCGWSVFRLLV
jgi:hypothetical protein